MIEVKVEEDEGERLVSVFGLGMGLCCSCERV